MSSFVMELEGLPQFQARMKQFPIDGEKKMRQIAKNLSVKLRNQMRARGFQSSGAASIKVGEGKQYGHTINAIAGHGGAIGWGMYVRVGVTKTVPSYYKVIFHELGTEERARGGSGKQTKSGYVWRPKKANKTGKKGFTGALRARNMIQTEGRIIIASGHFYVAQVEAALAEACK